MAKIKRVRTIDAVVMGWRPGKEENTVGSLILGLYDDDGKLRTVGHTSGLSAKRKRELVDELKPYETGERGMGDPSRWANDRDLEWVELRPELVVEVTFDHTSNDRIRHGTKISRWREDKDPAECRMEQLAELDHRGGRRAGAAARLHALAVRPPLLQAVELLARGEQLRAVLDAPARERGERGQQVLPGGRELVAHARGHAREDVALDQPVALELAQRRAQHAARDAVDLAQQLVEAARAGVEAGEHDDAPLGGQHADGGLQRLQVVAVDAGGGCGLNAHRRSMNVGTPDPVSPDV